MMPDNEAQSPITVTVTPTRSDFVRFNLRLTLRRSRLLFLIAAFWLSVMMCATFGLRALFPAQPQPGVGGYAYLAPALVLPVAVFVLLPLTTYIAARRRWNSAAELREPREYTFTDEGIRVAGETFAAFTAWSHIVTVGQSGRLIYLGTRQGLFHFIPLSAFQSDEDLERFSSLVADQVEDCKL